MDVNDKRVITLVFIDKDANEMRNKNGEKLELKIDPSINFDDFKKQGFSLIFKLFYYLAKVSLLLIF